MAFAHRKRHQTRHRAACFARPSHRSASIHCPVRCPSTIRSAANVYPANDRLTHHIGRRQYPEKARDGPRPGDRFGESRSRRDCAARACLERQTAGAVVPGQADRTDEPSGHRHERTLHGWAGLWRSGGGSRPAEPVGHRRCRTSQSRPRADPPQPRRQDRYHRKGVGQGPRRSLVRHRHVALAGRARCLARRRISMRRKCRRRRRWSDLASRPTPAQDMAPTRQALIRRSWAIHGR